MLKTNRLLICFFILLSILFLVPVYDFSAHHLLLTGGDDYFFHFSRITAMIEQLKENGLPAYFSAFGEPKILYSANLFYPSLTSVYPIALFSLGTKSLTAGLYLYVFLLNLFTCFSCFISAKYVLNRTIQTYQSASFLKIAPIVFTVLYVFSTYRLNAFYGRMALGEFVSISFYPLVFAGFYSLVFDSGKKKSWLILGLTGLAYTHLLSAILSIVMLVVLFVCSLIARKINKAVMWQLVSSAVITILLSAASIVPIAYELAYFPVRSVLKYPLINSSYGIKPILLSSLKNELSYTSMGTVLILGLGVGASLFLFKKKLPIMNNSLLYGLLLISLAICFLLTNKFPWSFFQETPVSTIQFPFRLSVYLLVFGLFFVSIIFTDLGLTLLKNKWLFLALGTVCILGVSFYSTDKLITGLNQDKTFVFHSDEELLTSRRFQNYRNKDYFVKGLTAEQEQSIFTKKGWINQEERPMPYEWKNGQTSFNFMSLTKSSAIDLPIVAYPGLHVYDESGQILPSEQSERGTFLIQLDKPQKVVIAYHAPIIIRISQWISALTLLTFVSLPSIKKRRR
ncbi:hypothetical protein IGI37_002607 [Enterococcus sp. AZ194]|uniref:hypothetical protein n=1 Tax=Enterococcus sp. AZ194 TaxID=2774629 RepID=UPI003F241E37